MRIFNIFPNDSIQGIKFGSQQGVLLELEDLLLKFIWKNKDPRIAETIFKMKKGTVILPHIVIKTKWWGLP